MFVKISAFLAVVSLFLLPMAVAMGQEQPQILPPGPGGFTMTDVYTILNTIVNWFFAILIILAVFFIFVAAFYYLTAAGDAEKVKTAHATLIYALVAIAVALLAKGLVYLVGNIVVETPVSPI